MLLIHTNICYGIVGRIDKSEVIRDVRGFVQLLISENVGFQVMYS